MRIKGTIISWNDKRGFGFIKPNMNKNHIFVHIKCFTNQNRRPEINLPVYYIESVDNEGRPRAINVEFVGDKAIESKKHNPASISVYVALCFLAIVGISVFINKIPPLVLGIYVLGSLVTFLWYAKDKSAAQNDRWRTPENTLHIMSLIGGWPGAMIAQQKLRHKSKKQPFRMIFWVTVLMNCGAFIWFLTPEGSATLHSLIANIKIP